MGLRMRPGSIDLAACLDADAGEATLDGPMPGLRSRVLWRSLELADDCEAAVAAIARHGEGGLEISHHVFDAQRLAR